MRITLILLLILNSPFSYGQKEISTDWTEKEVKQYQVLTALAQYIHGKNKSEISNEVLFEKYIEFDYVLKDTSKIRKEKRIQSFDTLFYFFRKPIDSLGINNLDAKPIRFYKRHKVYEPFKNQLAEIASDVFVYFENDRPRHPKGTLWFDPKSNKLLAWILLDQGGTRYFLTFNLL